MSQGALWTPTLTSVPASVAKKNSFLRGRNLEQDQAHMGGTLLLMATQVMEEKK